jgi:hypothetical protein
MPSYVGRDMPKIESVVRPILVSGLPDHITVVTWTPDVDHRTGAPHLDSALDLKTYPLVKIRRFGGLPNQKRPDLLDRAVIELTAFSTARDSHYVGYGGTEDLLLDAQHLIFEAVRNQKVVEDIGYLHSWFQTMGPIQLDSPFDDTWRWQSLIQLGLRPVRSDL